MRKNFVLLNPAKLPLRITNSRKKLNNNLNSSPEGKENFFKKIEEKRASNISLKTGVQKQGSMKQLLISTHQNNLLHQEKGKENEANLRRKAQSTAQTKNRVQSKKVLFKYHQNQVAELKTVSSSKQDGKIEEIATEIIQKMGDNFYLSLKSGIISIKKSRFEIFLSELIDYLSNSSQMAKYEQTFLSGPLSKINQTITKSRWSASRQRLTLNQGIVDNTVDPQEYKNEITRLSLNVLKLQGRKKEVYIAIQKLQEQEKKLNQRCRDLQIESTNLARQVFQKKEEFSNLKTKYDKILSSIIEGERRLDKINDTTNKIVSYIQVQGNASMIQESGESFKKIQSQILDYAAQIDGNPLYLSPSYEPKPYSAVQKNIRLDLINVTDDLKSQKFTLEQKQKKMRQFVLETMQTFKHKDKDMTDINKMRTECCLKFVRMMRKLFQNWQLKQKLLTNLRSEFADKSNTMNEVFQKFNTLQMVQALPDKADLYIRQLNQNWKNIEVNYKLGNSFY